MPSRTPIPVQRALRQLGDNLVAARKLQRLTAAQVGERAGVGRMTVGRLERGEAGVSLEITLRVARALRLMEPMVRASDPYGTDVGRLRADEVLPTRVGRPRRPPERDDTP